jgi:hypothetical protein
MARRVILSDDFDNSESDDVQTRYFMMGAGNYREIDLNDANWTQFQKATKKFYDASRETTVTRVRAAAPDSPANDDSVNARIRTWARQNGYPDLGERGRIPEDIVDAYNKAVEDGSYDKWFKEYTANLPAANN